MLYSYSFSNRKRDLSDILATVIRDEPRFISNFKAVPEARMRKHEWLEDQMQGRSITAGAVSGGTLTVNAADAAKVRVGTLLAPEGSSALFTVTAVTPSAVTIALAAANGSGMTLEDLPAGGLVFKVISTPMGEGSVNGDGEEHYAHAQAEYNTTQIFRKEIVLSGSALAVNVYGSADNQLNRQTAFALADLARDLNRVALFGRRIKPPPVSGGKPAAFMPLPPVKTASVSTPENAPLTHFWSMTAPRPFWVPAASLPRSSAPPVRPGSSQTSTATICRYCVLMTAGAPMWP